MEMGRVKNLAGLRFGRLKAATLSHKQNGAIWECLCDCGKTCLKKSSYLNTKGINHSCGDCQRTAYNRVDHTGKIYGDLRVIEIDKILGHVVFWKCLCQCGNSCVKRANDLKKSKSCGCLQQHKDPRQVNISAVYKRYQLSASKRKLSWDLALDNFLILTAKDCHYCGAKPQNSYNCYKAKAADAVITSVSEERAKAATFFYNGLDRINNSMGYSQTNVVPCCRFCNVAKGKRSYSDFQAWCHRLSIHYEVQHGPA